MNTKILVSLLVIGLTAIAIGGAAYTGAFFSDTETSTGNTFAAGTLTLEMKDANEDWTGNGVIGTLTYSGMVPGDSTTGKICFKNTGSVNGYLVANMSIASGPEAFAKALKITNADFGSGNVANYWAQQIIAEEYPGNPAGAVTAGYVIASGSDYLPTVYGMTKINLYRWTSYSNHTEVPLAASSAEEFCEELTVQFHDTNQPQNDLQGATVTATITGTLDQNQHA